MTYLSKSTLLAALIVPAAAFAGLDVGQHLGTTEADVRAALTGMGYTVDEIETEDGDIEAEVTMGGVTYEVEVAASTGLVVAFEAEDDADDSDD